MWWFFCGSFLLFVFIFVMSASCSLVITCWDRADRLAHLYLMGFFCPFPIWCSWLGVIVIVSISYHINLNVKTILALKLLMYLSS